MVKRDPLENLIFCLFDLMPRVVIVSGAQRSGTTISAHILAHELDYKYVDEEAYGTKNLLAWKHLIKTGQNIVIHSPAMARWLHEISEKDVAVVWMLRPARDVDASIARIQWQGVATEMAKYKDTGYIDGRRLFSQVKNSYWQRIQRPLLENTFELQYSDLSKHPLFLKKEQRLGFTSRQWMK